MPRLENKKHELYCYGRVYHSLPKIRAIEFAGYKPYPMNYKRVEERPEVQARIVEMQGTPKEELYQEGAEVPQEPDSQAEGAVIANYLWLMNELRRNMIDARACGKFRESNDAIAQMAKLMAIESERSNKVDELAQQRSKRAGIKLNAPTRHPPKIPKKPDGSTGVGGSPGDEFEDEAGDAIVSPLDLDTTDGDDRS